MYSDNVARDEALSILKSAEVGEDIMEKVSEVEKRDMAYWAFEGDEAAVLIKQGSRREAYMVVYLDGTGDFETSLDTLAL